MSMKPQAIPEIPAETVRVVRAVFPKGNIYIHLRDTLGAIYQDELFADLYPDRGQPAYAPWRLALVTVFQFMENLTDRQAADAVRSRLDWKYALSLELTDPGFDHTVLSEFRTRLVALSAEERFLEAVLMLCKEHGWLKARGRQRTDSTHVLAKVRALNRTACVVETLRHAKSVLAVGAPDRLRSQVQPEWLERYGPHASEYRFPSGTDKRQQFEQQVGQDGWGVLAAIKADTQSHWMLSIPAIDTLQRVWKQDYLPLADGGTWIADEDRLEAARLCYSPYDLAASAAKKRSTDWIGYKVHFTETCDEDLPRLITHVATDIGPIPDREALPEIHAALQAQALALQPTREWRRVDRRGNRLGCGASADGGACYAWPLLVRRKAEEGTSQDARASPDRGRDRPRAGAQTQTREGPYKTSLLKMGRRKSSLRSKHKASLLDCQAIERVIRSIHHRESLYRSLIRKDKQGRERLSSG